MTYYESNSYYSDEMAKEKRVGALLDKEFYEPNFKEWKRNNTNIDYQKRGVDTGIIVNGETWYVDEKAANSAYNYDLNTFSIEVGMANNCPWFELGEDNFHLTTHYLFVWPRANDSLLEDITSFDAYLVPKKAILDFFEEIELTKNVIEHFDFMANSTDYKDRPYLILKDYYGEKVKVVKSTKFKYKPINALIPKAKLAEMAVKTLSYRNSAF